MYKEIPVYILSGEAMRILDKERDEYDDDGGAQRPL